MALPLRQAAGIVCKFKVRGSPFSGVLSRAVEVVRGPCSLPGARPNGINGQPVKPPRFPQSNLHAKHPSYHKNPQLIKTGSSASSQAKSSFGEPKATLAAYLIAALHDYTKMKFPKDGTATIWRRILKRLIEDVLERLWTMVVQKVTKGIKKAVFWAATVLLFLCVKVTNNGLITIDLKVLHEEKEDEAKDVAAKVVEAVREEILKISEQQDKSFKKLEENSARRWIELRQELSLFRIKTEVALIKHSPKRLDFSCMTPVDPEEFVPPFVKGKK